MSGNTTDPKDQAPRQASSESTRLNEKYIIQSVDIGMSLEEVIEKSANPEKSEPTEKQKQILNDLLFNNSYEEEFQLADNFRVKFRTASGSCVQNGYLLMAQIQKELESKKEMSVSPVHRESTMKFVTIAQYLVACGNNSFEVEDRNLFSSVDEIRRRYEFVCNCSSSLIDHLGRLQTAFLRNVHDALRVERVKNF